MYELSSISNVDCNCPTRTEGHSIIELISYRCNGAATEAESPQCHRYEVIARSNKSSSTAITSFKTITSMNEGSCCGIKTKTRHDTETYLLLLW